MPHTNILFPALRKKTFFRSLNQFIYNCLHSFPYDIQRSPNFELTYLWFVQATFTAVFGTLATDTFYYGCALALSGHLRVVQHRIGRLNFERAGDNDRLTGNDYKHRSKRRRRISREFRELLAHHERVLAMCADLVDVCVPIVFTQFWIASMQLCVVAYQLTLVCCRSVDLMFVPVTCLLSSNR